MAKIKEVMCGECKEGTGMFRHDNHLIHKFPISCRKCIKTKPKLTLTSKDDEGVEHFLKSIAKRFNEELELNEGDIAYQIVCDEYYKFRGEK